MYGASTGDSLGPGVIGSVPKYLAAFVCTGAALLVRWALEPYTERYPYFTIYLAILVSARFFGVGPSVAAAILGGAAASYLFGTAGHRLLPSISSVGFLFYLAIAGLAIWLIHWLRHDVLVAANNAHLADLALQSLLEETEERERERKRSAQLRAIVESSDDGIVSQNLEGMIQSWNRGAETIFGYTADEVLGQPIGLLLPPGRSHEESDIIERIRHGGRVKHFETMRKRKDAVLFPVSLSVSPIYDAAGKVAGASHIVRDITEAKELERQLRQKQKMESLGVLAGGLAHDFNNLLTGIMGNASLVLSQQQDQTCAERVSEILQASERAALLIRQMLAYAGKGRFVVEQLDISEQVREIMPLLRSSVSRLVTLDLHLAGDLPLVDADRAQIQQVIMNLAVNAAEAIGDNAGTVTISTVRRDTDQEWQVVLEVGDTGSGMDDATKGRIFDPFFTTKFTGRGLGLAAVLGIIRSHRGSISVDSAPGRGSKFTVVLPAALHQQRTAAPPEPEVELRGYGNILVVDDEELVRNMACYTLDHLGYTTLSAKDGRDAVELFARGGDFSAVLLDLTMPVMNGEEALGQIQRLRPDVPVVLSSGFSEEEALERFRNRGLAGFLQKPYTATALARKVKAAVKRSRS